MAVANSLANRQTRSSMATYMSQEAVRKQINSVVGGKNATRFVSSIVSAVQTTPALQECTNQSILSAALLGEALNLSPSPQLGQFYMVPFKNNKKGCKEAQFQLGYKGYIQLAVRSGYYKRLNVMAIKEGELLHYDPLNEEIEVNLIEMTSSVTRHLQPVIMPCSSMRTDSERQCTGRRRRCWHTPKSIPRRLEGMAGRDRWNSWKPGRSRKRPLEIFFFLVQGFDSIGIEDHAPPDHQQMGHYEHRPAERPGQGHGSDPRGRKS